MPSKYYTNYYKRESWLKSYGRALKNNVFFHLPFPWTIRVVHDLDLHLKRMLFNQEHRKDSEKELTFEDLYRLLEKN